MSSRAAVNAAVKEAFDAGLCVIPPAEDGTKKPFGAWKEYQQERPTLDQLRELYSQERHGLGVVGGAVSGELEVLEFESEKVYGLFKEHAGLAGLDDVVARIEDGYLEQAPRGGRHWLWRTDKAGGNTKLAMAEDYETLIETRGAGGFCILAPSYGPVHPTGKPYVRLSGSFEAIPVVDMLEERKPLLEVARSLCRAPKQDDQRVWVPKGGPVGDRPGDDFNARGNWQSDILKPAGWSLITQMGEQQYWRRPGKDDGHSAVLHLDTDIFVPFSSSTPFPVTQVGYGKFSCYAILHHDGDFSAAATELKRRGYGKTREEKRELWAPPPSQIMRGNQLAALELPEITTLPVLGREGFFIEGGANLLYGYPKVGKTDLTLALVRDWIAEGRRVCYFTEESLFFWKARLAALDEPWEFWEPLLLCEALSWGVDRVLTQFTEDDVTVVDTIRSTAGYRESESDKDVVRVVERLILGAREKGTTLIAGYHARKMPGEDGTDISGHHSLFGAFDRAVQLKRVSGEGNDRKRCLSVFGRLLDPTQPSSLTYEMTGAFRFRALDGESITRLTPRPCESCGEEFTPLRRDDARTCSDVCRKRKSRGAPDVTTD